LDIGEGPPLARAYCPRNPGISRPEPAAEGGARGRRVRARRPVRVAGGLREAGHASYRRYHYGKQAFSPGAPIYI